MTHCLLIQSFIVFQGYSPQESCELVVKEAQRKAGTTSKPFEMALIAINKKVILKIFWYHIALKSYFTVFMKATCSKCKSINAMYTTYHMLKKNTNLYWLVRQVAQVWPACTTRRDLQGACNWCLEDRENFLAMTINFHNICYSKWCSDSSNCDTYSCLSTKHLNQSSSIILCYLKCNTKTCLLEECMRK